jgi:hypothetical protein
MALRPRTEGVLPDLMTATGLILQGTAGTDPEVGPAACRLALLAVLTGLGALLVDIYLY